MNTKAHYHLPGLFQFYDFYKKFLPVYKNHRNYFYDWCEIASIYGAPDSAIWNGGRETTGNANSEDVLQLMESYHLSSRLTFSNSLLKEEHLKDICCNELCQLFSNPSKSNGVIVCSSLLEKYLTAHYPNLYLVSSTTKVLNHFNDLKEELNQSQYQYVVADYRLNHCLEEFSSLNKAQKDKVELLVNENCDIHCTVRKACYDHVSRLNLNDASSFRCPYLKNTQGYLFSEAMNNPGFISVSEIENIYLPLGIHEFKIEGRGLGSALLLEFILYYLIKPEYHLKVREAMYLDNMLDLF